MEFVSPLTAAPVVNQLVCETESNYVGTSQHTTTSSSVFLERFNIMKFNMKTMRNTLEKLYESDTVNQLTFETN